MNWESIDAGNIYPRFVSSHLGKYICIFPFTGTGFPILTLIVHSSYWPTTPLVEVIEAEELFIIPA